MPTSDNISIARIEASEAYLAYHDVAPENTMHRGLRIMAVTIGTQRVRLLLLLQHIGA